MLGRVARDLAPGMGDLLMPDDQPDRSRLLRVRVEPIAFCRQSRRASRRERRRVRTRDSAAWVERDLMALVRSGYGRWADGY